MPLGPVLIDPALVLHTDRRRRAEEVAREVRTTGQCVPTCETFELNYWGLHERGVYILCMSSSQTIGAQFLRFQRELGFLDVGGEGSIVPTFLTRDAGHNVALARGHLVCTCA